MKNKICTAIVTFNRLDLLKEAIESIRSQTQSTDILVINNGSTDGTFEYLSSLDDIIIINQENVGGAGGFYTALKYISEHDYEFAWVMDDDIVAEPDTLSNLYKAYLNLSIKEKIGFLCSLVVSAEGETVNVPTIDPSPNSTGYPDWNKYLEEGIVKVIMATFVSVFIPVTVIKEVGLPIKEFFIWGDDTEYTLRISNKYSSYLIGKSKIKHLRNGGILNLKNFNDPNRIKMFRKFIRNNAFNKRKYESRKALTIYYLRFIKDFLAFALKGEFNKSKVICQGLIDGIKFNPTIDFPKSK